MRTCVPGLFLLYLMSIDWMKWRRLNLLRRFFSPPYLLLRKEQRTIRLNIVFLRKTDQLAKKKRETSKFLRKCTPPPPTVSGRFGRLRADFAGGIQPLSEFCCKAATTQSTNQIKYSINHPTNACVPSRITISEALCDICCLLYTSPSPRD